MRLAFCLFKYFPFGGLQRDFMRISRECFERGHSIDVYTMSWEGDIPEGYQVHQLPKKGLSNHRRALRFAKQVQAKLAQKKYDCVIGFNKMPGLNVYFAADGCFKSRVQQQHSPLYRLNPRYRAYVELEKSVFDKHHSCKILLLNEQEKANFISCYGTTASRFHLVPPGISTDRVATPDAGFICAELRHEFGVDKRDFLIVSVATEFKTKGLERSLKAIAALPEAVRKRIHFFVIGGDSPALYLPLAKKLGIEKNLIFLGARLDVERFLMAADLVLHPAVQENAGMVLIEALACGAPILTTANCGYAFHVSRAQAGRVLETPFSQTALNQALLTVLNDLPSSKSTWSENALDYTSRIDIFGLPEDAATIIEQRAC